MRDEFETIAWAIPARCAALFHPAAHIVRSASELAAALNLPLLTTS
jgi:hypothetical protein